MEARVLIGKLKDYKECKKYTLHDLSKLLDVSTSTLERWFKRGRINRLYAQMVRDKLNL